MTAGRSTISIITAVYNNKNTVDSALASIREQSYPFIEHVVIDGGSTDGTLETLKKHSVDIDVLISEPDGGMYNALNKGINYCSGEIVGFLHADDFFADRAVLEDVSTTFAKNDVDGVYGDLEYVSSNNPDRVVRRWRSGHFSQCRLSWGWMPPHPTLFLRREIYERFGRFDESYRIAADYDFMLRFLSAPGTQVEYIPRVLIKMRLGGMSNKSLANIIRKSLEDYRALSSNRVGGIGALFWKNASKLRQFG